MSTMKSSDIPRDPNEYRSMQEVWLRLRYYAEHNDPLMQEIYAELLKKLEDEMT